MTTVGVLALQGAFAEHINYVDRVPGARGVAIRSVRDIPAGGLDGLVIPGGESTTMGKLLDADAELKNWLLDFMFVQKKSVWGTCAGLILLAKEVENGRANQFLFRAMDITVQRNYFGAQTLSFQTTIVPKDGRGSGEGGAFPATAAGPHLPLSSFPGTFIRAPIVTKCHSQMVKVLAEIAHRLPASDETRTVIVAVEQDNFLGTSFHPELTGDTRWHEWWITTRVRT